MIDSSVWIEYLNGTKTGEKVKPIIDGTGHIIASPINVAEIYVKEAREKGERLAEEGRAFIAGRCEVVNLTEEIAHEAAKLRLEKRLGLADALIYSTASSRGAELLT
ncbi:type II toxin-antitoxin system VapC family toxin, partial [archaeon]|nr:type II toxin-antitoxin system VapC family toxin [archaeon]